MNEHAPSIVRGTIRHADGRPLAGGTVRAFDHDLRHRQLLGECPAGKTGEYRIPYRPHQFRRAEKETADLRVLAFDEKDQEIARSPIRFNAGPDETIDLVIGGGVVRGPSEFEQLVAQLTPLLDGAAFAELVEDDQHQDITFLSRETGDDPGRIGLLVAAHRLADGTIPPDVFYGMFRRGLPTALPALLVQSPDTLRHAIVQSAGANIIAPRFAAEADALVDGLALRSVAEAMKPPANGNGGASIDDLLGLALDGRELRAAFLTEYVRHTGPVERFWSGLAVTPEFKDRIPGLQLTLQLGALTGNHPPLVRELQQRLGTRSFGADVVAWIEHVVSLVRRTERGREPSPLAMLTSLGEDDWLRVIRGSGDGAGRIGAPPGVPGNDDDERERTYARAIAHIVEDAFPTAFVTHRLQGDDLPGRDDLVAFLTANPQFDIRATRLARYVKDHAGAFANVADVQGTTTRLAALQRVYRLAPRYAQTSALLKAGLDSAHRISRLGRNAFSKRYAAPLGGRAQADAIHTAATNVNDMALAVLVDHSPMIGRVGLTVLPDETVTVVDGVPEWSSLFGSVELCSCEHCRSVHGPAAYLVDLLAFLGNRDSTIANRSVKDILFARRPDLGEIELTCENTNTPLPYVDLVNEALENAVAPPRAFTPFDLPAAVEADLNRRRLSPALGNAFTPPLSSEAVITAGAHGKPWDVNPGWWTVDEPGFTYSVRRDAQTNRLRVVARSLQTRGTAAERAAGPQYINAEAYRALGRAVYPWSLPWAHWWEEARAYLRHLGVPRHLAMERFRAGDRRAILSDVAVACEYLGLTREVERDVAGNIVAQHGTAPLVIGAVTGDPDAASPGPWNLWGFATQNLTIQSSIVDPTDRTRRIAGGDWLDVLRGRVDVFLHQSGLTYREMLALLDTFYVNPVAGNARSIRIVSTDASVPETCETRRLRLEGFDQAAAARTLRFVRLWRALGWSMRDLDRAITALRPAHFDALNVTGAGVADNERFLVQLAHVQRLHHLLDVPVARLVGWWADIDTAFYIDHDAPGQPRIASVYDQLFRDRATVNPPDPAFAQDPAALNGTLSAHAASIAAALGITGAELALMLADAAVIPRDPADNTRPDDRLTLDALSRLHRHASLAKALRLPVRDYLAGRRLAATDPFATTADTLLFVETMERARASGFTFAELDYLLRHAFAPDSTIAPAEPAVAVFLGELRATLQGVAAENTFREASARSAHAADAVDPTEPTTDPTGELTRRKLALLNWDADWVDQAVATLGGAVVYEALLAALPPSLTLPNATGAYAVPLAALPAGFAVPPELRDAITHDAAAGGRLTATRYLGAAERTVLRAAGVAAGDAALLMAVDALFREQDELDGEIAYDAPRQRLRFSGPMTAARRQRLIAAPGGDAAYQAAVQALYDRPRQFVERAMRTFAVHDFVAENVTALPAAVRIPAGLARKIYLEPAAGRLHCAGVMSDQERETLLALSTDTADAHHTAYQLAVRALHDQAAALVPAAGDAFLTAAGANNDAAVLFETVIPPGERYLHVLRRLLRHLRRTLSERLAVEKAAGTLQIETRAADLLVRMRLRSPVDPQRSCLDELVDPGFADSSPGVPVTPAAFPRQFAAFVRAHKASLVVSRFALGHRQLGRLFDHGPRAGWLDLNALPADTQSAPAPLDGLLRLAELVRVRDGLPQGEDALDEILTRASAVPAAAPAAARDAAKQAWVASVARWTRWAQVDLETLVGAAGDHAQRGRLDVVFPDDYAGVRLLARLQDAFGLLKRLGTPAAQAAELAAGEVTQAIARSVRQAVRAKYEEAQWLTLAKPLHDVLREKRRAALVAYLAAHLRLRLTQLESPHPVLAFNAARPLTRPAVRELQRKLNAGGAGPVETDGVFGAETRDAVTRFQRTQGLTDNGVADASTWARLDDVSTSPHDAGDLYAHFLIDVEMSPCATTSRITQALGSVQLFVQRCRMRLEPDVVASAAADVKWREWTWMKNYRVWEANRKVFLYPENWIEPELRDDKSPFFRELESELLQSDLTAQTVEEAFLHYLEKLDHVARLEIVGTYHQVEHDASGQVAVDVLHVFGRTPGVPHVYFHRQRVDSAFWTAWERLVLDIEGNHLIPVVWNRRLLLFWPVFVERAKPVNVAFDGASLSGTTPEKYWEIRLAWSERKDNQWTDRRMSSGFLVIDLRDLTDTPAKFHFRTAAPASGDLVVVAIFQGRDPSHPYPVWDAQGFHFTGCSSDPAVIAGSLLDIGLLEPQLIAPVLASPPGTASYNMFFQEIDDAPLYLQIGESQTSGLVVPTFAPVLGRTPGQFVLLPPRPTTAEHPFFFQDERRTYFVTPVRVDAPTARLPEAERIDPGLVIDVSEPYWNALAPTAGATEPAVTDDLPFGEPSLPVIEGAATNGSRRADFRLYGFRAGIGFRFHTFYHPHVCTFVRELNRNGVDGLLQRPLQIDPHAFTPRPTDPPFSFRTEYEPDQVIRPVVFTPYPVEEVDFDDDAAYALYNWELFFHAPLLIADRLARNQRYEDALKWFHYIFDPTDDSGIEAPRRYWRTRPFHERTRDGYQRERIQYLLRVLAEGANPQTSGQLTGDEREDLARFQGAVSRWRKHPFQPHLVARTRTTAYQKAVVMKYLDTLILWGDQLFRRDTIESNNEATQLYVLAAEILGRRPADVPPRATPTVQTYNSLEPRLDDFSDALVQIEEFIPPSAAGSGPPPSAPPSPINTLAPSFCISRNEKLLGYWDTVADRLFKLRHCMNIEGVARQLPLFEPPIDPALLVRAVAAGVDLGSVLEDVGAGPTRYRFNVLAQKAAEVCAELKSLSQSLLSALEKRDAEQLSLLRARQETALLDLVEQVRRLQADEAEQNKAALSRSRDLAVGRLVHYQKLLGVQSPQVPGIGEAIAPATPSPHIAIQEEGSVKIIPYEKEEMELLEQANEWQRRAAAMDVASSVAHIVPNWNVEPWGVGATFGGSNVGAFLSALAASFRARATDIGYEASNAGRLGQYALRAHDWLLQSNTAAQEIMQIDQQYLAADLRHQIAQKELQNHRRQREDARVVEDFLRDKYTSQELYGWMLGQLATTCFQTYQLAFDLAKRAERSFRHELGLNDSSFIQFGYWDSLRKGLLAGERLHHDLKRMEAAYLDQHKREYEITKNVSIRQLDPLALVQLRQTGHCTVTLPEALFDLDYPGHYMRRIRSVAVTIPCVSGPYTSVSCTLTLLRSCVRHGSTLLGGRHARQEGDPRFTDNLGAIESVVTSTGQNDSGLFEANVRDERYLPFEGAGVAGSQWQVELPAALPQFDYATIADVIMHVRYTARDGGGLLRQQAALELQRTLNDLVRTEGATGLAQLFSLRHEFSTEWHRFLHPAAAAGDQTITVPLTTDRFPFMVQNRQLTVERIELLAGVRPELAGTHNESTIYLTMAAGHVAPTSAAHQPADVLTLLPWNGLLRAEQRLALPPGTWTINAWLDHGGGPARLDPNAFEDIVLLCHYSVG